jgi:AmmeMemoRadiSam system protein A
VPEADRGTAAAGAVLPKLARRSLEQAFAPAAPLAGWRPLAAAGWLRRPAASFVTLRVAEALRGCVGSVEVSRPLAEDVWENARAAAFRDCRFPPLLQAELPGVAIEVSLLSPLESLGRLSRQEAERALRPGIDGLLLHYSACRGLFLPQVWEQLPSPDRFLAELAKKAGLPAGFWAAGVELWRFTVEKFAEQSGEAVG